MGLLEFIKFLFYIGLSGVKAFMSALIVAMAFFVEVFFINKYVDQSLASNIMPVIEMARTHWTWIFLVIFIFELIINYRTIAKKEKE